MMAMAAVFVLVVALVQQTRADYSSLVDLSHLAPPTVSSSSNASYVFCRDNKQKYCDSSLDIEERLNLLVSSLTVEEKITLVSPDPKEGNTCDCHSSRVDRVGLGSYMWLTETNTDVAAKCLGPDKCRTSYYGPLGMGASFNRTSWRVKGRVLSYEMRAYRNVGWPRGVAPEEQVGLSAFGPNLNIARDPRFGRMSELPGEDPYLVGQLGGYMLKGMQEKDKEGRPRVAAFMKHFTAYSCETNRGHDNYNISSFDLFDTYLRQYQIASQIGHPAGVMCSYNAINGYPSCAHGFLLKDVLRGRFKLPDAIVTTDCGAVSNLRGEPVLSPDNAHSSAYVINNGTDLEMGSSVLREPDGLIKAIKDGLVEEKTLTSAVQRLYRWLFRVGLFDKYGSSPYDLIKSDIVNSSKHIAIAHQAALQCPVLLRNDKKLLPLKTAAGVVLVGPLGDDGVGMVSSYASQPFCFNGTSCIKTLLVGMNEAFDANLPFEAGVPVDGNASKAEVNKALDLARDAKVVILALGVTKEQEREGLDKATTDLPQVQADFAKQVFALGKPTVVILFNGCPLSVDFLKEHSTSDLSVVEAFNPNMRGTVALAELLTGAENRWGKLPYTVYPSQYQHQQNLTEFDMSAPPGRTYRYYTGKPLWPFGYGLSYTSFSLERCSCESEESITCEVVNTGDCNGDEVVQLYHQVKVAASSVNHPIPKQSLVGFKRVSLRPKESRIVKFALGGPAFELRNAKGEGYVYSGDHYFTVALGTLGGSGQDKPATCRRRYGSIAEK